jgi:hypothetical protein
MLLVVAAVATFATAIWAGVWPVVYCHDEKTPLEAVDSNDPTVFRDITVATRLTIITRPDQIPHVWGGLVMSRDDIAYGDMVARGTHDKFWNYADFCLYDSGSDSRTWPMDDSYSHGFQFISTDQRIDVNDLTFFSDFRFERTEVAKAPVGPNQP